MKYAKGQVWRHRTQEGHVLFVQEVLPDGPIEVSRQFLPQPSGSGFGLSGCGFAFRATEAEMDELVTDFALRQVDLVP